jgi:glycogen(starch) synthase
MRVFMLGWEFPPYISGGLGTACHGLTRGLDEVGVEVCFVLPTAIPVEQGGEKAATHVSLRSPESVFPLRDPLEPSAAIEEPEETLDTIVDRFTHVEIHRLAAALQPYGTPAPQERIDLVEVRREARRQASRVVLRQAIAKYASRGQAPSMEALPPTMQQKIHEALAPAPEKSPSPDKSPTSFVPVGAPNSIVQGGAGAQYEGDLMEQVQRYASLAVKLALQESFEVIHAHDWMTFPAGLAVAAATGKPLVVHVHSTEFDRSGENVNQAVYDIERAGMAAAARVVCVSRMTAEIVHARYGVAMEKIEVVYNAVEMPEEASPPLAPITQHEKIVLFLGRVTMQKGPEYFLQAARKVIGKYDKVRFVLAGSGDMIQPMIELAADLGLGHHVAFTGFLRGDDVNRIYQMADLYVMPSVSEPFGIAPLEALSHNVPVLISKQSGVAEVLTHALKVDFWDTDEMANKILAVLRHEPLQRTLRDHAAFELKRFSWRDSAAQLKSLYEQLI